jgi:aminoglycoside phosphotransferase (APT) family kinase protein
MTQPAWTPEREINPAEAERLVGSLFPDLSGSAAEVFAQGWDNTAVRFRTTRLGELIFRFPRRAIALPGVRRELAWLPKLAPLLPLPIPVPAFASWGDQGVDGWPFWGAPMLAGTELAEAAPRERVGIAAQLGAFLRVLHRLPPGEFAVDGAAALAFDPLGRGHPAQRAAKTAECLARLSERGDRKISAPFDALAGLLSRAAELPAPPPGVICHGDLHVRHVLISGAAITGVIDWGDLCLADPAVDLSIAFAAFSGPSREAFFAAYGPIDADRELRARALAISLSGLLTEYALDQISPDGTGSPLLPEVCDGLTRALEG